MDRLALPGPVTLFRGRKSTAEEALSLSRVMFLEARISGRIHVVVNLNVSVARRENTRVN